MNSLELQKIDLPLKINNKTLFKKIRIQFKINKPPTLIKLQLSSKILYSEKIKIKKIKKSKMFK